MRVSSLAREMLANVAMRSPRIAARRNRAGRYASALNPAVALSQFAFIRDKLGPVEGKVVAEVGAVTPFPWGCCCSGPACPSTSTWIASSATWRVSGPGSSMRNSPGSPPRRSVGAGAGWVGGRKNSPGRTWSSWSRKPSSRSTHQDSDPWTRSSPSTCWNTCWTHLPPSSGWPPHPPGGRMVHRIDDGRHDLGVAEPAPLDFLCPMESLWDAMGSARGMPNRRRHPEIMAALDAAGFDAIAEITNRFTVADIARSRPRLARRFRDMPDEGLIPKDAMIVAGAVTPLRLSAQRMPGLP